MTYCCGILVRDGLVMIADTRTNAGLDNISVFRKLHTFAVPGERIMAVATSGNLSLSQSVLSLLQEGIENDKTGERETLLNAPTMFQGAQRIGRAIRAVHETEDSPLVAADVKFDLAFLFGGQIKGERPRLFMVYSAATSSNARPIRPISRSASTNTASRCSTAPSRMTSTCTTRSRSASSRSIPPCAPT